MDPIKEVFLDVADTSGCSCSLNTPTDNSFMVRLVSFHNATPCKPHSQVCQTMQMCETLAGDNGPLHTPMVTKCQQSWLTIVVILK